MFILSDNSYRIFDRADIIKKSKEIYCIRWVCLIHKLGFSIFTMLINISIFTFSFSAIILYQKKE